MRSIRRRPECVLVKYQELIVPLSNSNSFGTICQELMGEK